MTDPSENAEMKPKTISNLEEAVIFFGGAGVILPINYAVKRGLISPVFDWINLALLAVLLGCTLIHIYWKLRKVPFKPGATRVWIGSLGCCFGAWLVSRFT